MWIIVPSKSVSKPHSVYFVKLIYLINWCFIYRPPTSYHPLSYSNFPPGRASTSNNKMFAVAKMLKFLQNCEFNPNQPWTTGISYGCTGDVEGSSPFLSDSLGTRSAWLTFQLFKLTRTKPLEHFHPPPPSPPPSSLYYGQCHLAFIIMVNVNTKTKHKQ